MLHHSFWLFVDSPFRFLLLPWLPRLHFFATSFEMARLNSNRLSFRLVLLSMPRQMGTRVRERAMKHELQWSLLSCFLFWMATCSQTRQCCVMFRDIMARGDGLFHCKAIGYRLQQVYVISCPDKTWFASVNRVSPLSSKPARPPLIPLSSISIKNQGRKRHVIVQARMIETPWTMMPEWPLLLYV